jgi:hypothetical protein
VIGLAAAGHHPGDRDLERGGARQRGGLKALGEAGQETTLAALKADSGHIEV